jgi:tetratricopeptide (TPR) repeat protein
MRDRLVLLAVSGLLFSATCSAATVADARALKDEALKMIQSGSNSEVDPKVYAEAEEKLLKAQGILESLNESGGTLAQEIAAALFWSRRFTVVHIAPKSGSTPRKTTAPATPAAPKTTAQPKKSETPKTVAAFGSMSTAEARARFEAAMKFAKENEGDDFVLALRWFQAADELAGTEYAAKALTLAREAQERNLAKLAAQDKKEELPDTPGYRLLRQADILAASGKYEQSFAMYKRALPMAPSAISYRKFGLAYFKYAQQLKDRLAPALEAAEEEYAKARRESPPESSWQPPFARGRFSRGRRPSSSESPALREAKEKIKALKARIAETDGYYDKAWEQFKKALARSPRRRNLDAAAHKALCLSLKFSLLVKDAAIIELDEVLKNYKPANDVERTLYEFCKSERRRLTGG